MPSDHTRQPPAHFAIAWTGAAAFLASLLWCAYLYVAGFDARAVRLTAPAAVTFDAVLFSIFAVHHSSLARARVKAWVGRHVPPELERSLYTWTASLLFAAVCAFWEPVPGTLYSVPGVWRPAAYAIQLVGVLLTVRSSAALGVLDLAGVRQVQHAREPATAGHVPLETHGLYGFVRHPLYFAWALMVFAAPDMTGTRATFAIVTTGYLALAIPWEERSLVRIFGPEYEAYQRQVRWRMIPGIY